jgi:hypothetical protein
MRKSMPVRKAILGGVVALFASAALPRPAAAQEAEFQFGIGYGHLFWDGAHSGPLEEQGGIRVDGRVTWCPDARHLPALRVGAGATLGSYFSNDDDGSVTFVGDVVIVEPSRFTQLSMFTPELEIAWRQWFDNKWYVEPGLAGMFIVGNFSKGEEAFGFVDSDIDEWRVGGGGRAFLRLGYHGWDQWSIGVEGSYAYGWLDFGHDVGGDIQQAYLGAFAAYRL